MENSATNNEAYQSIEIIGKTSRKCQESVGQPQLDDLDGWTRKYRELFGPETEVVGSPRTEPPTLKLVLSVFHKSST